MKIICIGRNYADHIKELNNDTPSEPVVFLKPDTALLKNNEPFYYPSHSSDMHHEVEVVVRIHKNGKFISPEFAHKYYDEIGLGVDFTARDVQQRLKEKGLPWEIAKGFNGSAPVSEMVPKSRYSNLQDLHFSLAVNGEIKQKGHTALMITTIDQMIAYVSQFFQLKTGDLIFTGTPAGVGPVKIGDTLTGFLEAKEMFSFSVK